MNKHTPETAAERDMLKEINAELLAKLEDLLSALDRQMSNPNQVFRSKMAARAVVAKAKAKGGAEQKETQQ